MTGLVTKQTVAGFALHGVMLVEWAERSERVKGCSCSIRSMPLWVKPSAWKARTSRCLEATVAAG